MNSSLFYDSNNPEFIDFFVKISAYDLLTELVIDAILRKFGTD
jgi:hypothetical protein